METIRIKNLRSLKDTKDINIKPLMVLVGKNSSGKSTFLRFFPLMKQTLETRINEPVLWYSSRYVDFGSFKESLNRKCSEELISFSFEFEISPQMLNVPHMRHGRHFFYSHMYREMEHNKQNNLNCHISIEFGQSSFESLYIRCADQEIKVTKSTKDKKFVNLLINNKEMKNIFFMGETEIGDFIPKIFFQLNEKKYTATEDYFVRELFTIFKHLAHQGTTDETIDEYLHTFFGNSQQILENLKNKRSSAKVLSNNVKKLKIDDEIFININDLFVGLYLNELINLINKYLKKYFTSVKYIAPLRASAERYYRIQGISLDEVDPQGENIPMLLQNMGDGDKSHFDEWMLENFHFKIKSNLDSGHSSLKIQYENGYEVNLADTGFGYSQILPIILILWQAYEKNNKKQEDKPPYLFFVEEDFNQIINIVIEQPELHLHPALQAMLVDSFVKIINLCKRLDIKISVIIETHSETIINRIGYLIAKNFEDINKEMVNILILDNEEDNYDTKVKTTSYTEEGFLKHWPFGFFSPEEV